MIRSIGGVAAVAEVLQVSVGALMAGVDPLGPTDLDPDEVRDVACDATAGRGVCEAPEIPEPPPPVQSSTGSANGLGAIAQLLLAAFVLALVVALGWVVWQVVAKRGVRDEAEDDDLDESEELDEVVGPRQVDDERPPDRWRRAAAAHRADGRFRDSIRCEYRALVGDLARAGYVDEIPGRTSGEERTQVEQIAPAGSSVPMRFAEAAEVFDVAWFDDRPVSSSDDERFVTLADEVLEGVLAR